MKASRPHWIREKLLNVIVQMGLDKLPDLPDVPAALDLVSDPVKKQVLDADPDPAGARAARSRRRPACRRIGWRRCAALSTPP